MSEAAVDRSLIVVRPKQPFLDWTQRIDFEKDMTLESIREDPSAYLVPLYDYDDERPLILEVFFADIFEAELDSWYTDQTLWPENRDLQMFLDWFDVEFHSGVFDLCGEPIQVDYAEDVNSDPNSNGH